MAQKPYYQWTLPSEHLGMENYDEEQATAVWTEDVDRTEEERLITYVRTAKYLEGLRRYYNRNIKGHSFAVSDIVLHRK